MIEILKKLCLSKDMICIYANRQDTSKFHFGTIMAVNEQDVAIGTISPDGEFDGIVVIGIECINHVETNSRYVEKIKKLCSGKAVLLSNLQIDNRDIKTDILFFAYRENLIASIEILDSGYNDIVGIIKNINDTECEVEQYDEYGCRDGEAYFRINDVTKISVLTQEEKRIMKLLEP